MLRLLGNFCEDLLEPSYDASSHTEDPQEAAVMLEHVLSISRAQTLRQHGAHGRDIGASIGRQDSEQVIVALEELAHE